MQEIYLFKSTYLNKTNQISAEFFELNNKKSSMDAYIRIFSKSKYLKKMKNIILLALFCFCTLSSQILSLPAPRHLLQKAVQTLTNMKQQIITCESVGIGRHLRRHRNSCSNQKLHQAVSNADKALNDIEEYLKKQGVNNIIIGKNNRIAGDKNIAIGNQNTLTGDNNWIIQKKGYNGVVENFLIYQSWAIDLNKIAVILTHPWSVIKRIQKDDIRKCRCHHELARTLKGVFHYH